MPPSPSARARGITLLLGMILGAFVVVAPASGRAQSIYRTYWVTGEVTSILNFTNIPTPTLPFAVGSPYSAALTLDITTPDAAPLDPDEGHYNFAVTEFTFTVGSYTQNNSDWSAFHSFNDAGAGDTWGAITSWQPVSLGTELGDSRWTLVDFKDSTFGVYDDGSFRHFHYEDLLQMDRAAFELRFSDVVPPLNQFLQIDGKITSFQSLFAPVAAWSTSVASGGNGTVLQLIDDSGLSPLGADIRTLTHDAPPNASTMWHAGTLDGGLGGPTGNPPAVDSQALIFDLGETFEIGGLYLWNHNQSGLTGRGVEDFEISVSTGTNPATASFTSVGLFSLSPAAGVSGETAQVATFTPATARLVRVDIDTGQNGFANDFVGLSEVRVLPEPGLGSALAGGILLLSATARRRRRTSRRPPTSLMLIALLGFLVTATIAEARSFWAFETGPVRPMAMSSDGTRLYVTNIPDQRLEIFALGGAKGPVLVDSVEVGLEPCAVALRSDTEAWVVNHLSDSISIVDVSTTPARVVRTLLVGDEPRDIVFAGATGDRAFITTAHRGQHHPNDPQLQTPGVGRADVWVFDATSLGDELTGTPETILQLFADTPRALAASDDGSLVYAAAFHSGNQTTTWRENFLVPTLSPTANTVAPIEPTPIQGRILGFDGTDWVDALGNVAPTGTPRFQLPDQDVFKIDADAVTPVVLSDDRTVGTILFDLAIHPTSGKVFVANTDANNRDRFEGTSATFGSLRGELHKARITILDGTTVTPRHLNKHLATLPDYAVPASPPDAAKSLATPVDVVFNADGTTLYVAAFGSSKIGRFTTTELEADTFIPDESSHIELSGGGPAAIVLDETRGLLYAYTRFDHALAIVDLEREIELFSIPLADREPAHLKDGRSILYDAKFSSQNGEASCSACHIFGDLDSLAWNLGDPDLPVIANPNPFVPSQNPLDIKFHPLKGPMTTQSLRGMDHHGPLHWRGDRTAVASGGVFDDEFANFLEFNGAFVGLLGRSTQLTPGEMMAFGNFALDLVPPPNPIRAIDNSLTTTEQLGHDIFIGPATDGTGNCIACHGFDPALGQLGADGLTALSGQFQETKVPQLRTLYQKVGMFGMDGTLSPLGSQLTGDPNDDQIRGFGFLHDGSFDSLNSFTQIFTFGAAATEFGLADVEEARDAVIDFLFAFPNVLAPVVGQQVTARSNATPTPPPFPSSITDRIQLFETRAATAYATPEDPSAMECDLIVKGTLAGEHRGYLFDPVTTLYQPDRASDSNVSRATLLTQAAVADQELTWTCMPPGSGLRTGIDRDEDGALDGDDNCPSAPNSVNEGTCIAGDAAEIGTLCTINAECGVAGTCSLAQEDADLNDTGDACEPTIVPEPGFATGLVLSLLSLALYSAPPRSRDQRGRGPRSV